MLKIAGTILINTLTILAVSTGSLFAAENRVPTPEEFKEIIRQYNESGKYPDMQRTRQVSKANDQFRRALSLHTKKGATASELKEAASLYQSAVDAGMPPAATNLALLYLEGKGVKKDVKKALALLNSASKMNDSQADVTLARLYLIGKDVKRDDKKGESLLNKAAKAGNQNTVKMLAEYKEWKKKNEAMMKQYQEVLKKAQSTHNMPVATSTAPQPATGLPLPPKAADLPFPVIPGYAYLGANRPVTPPVNIVPAQLQPINIVPAGGGAFQSIKVEAASESGSNKPDMQAPQPKIDFE